MVLAAVNFIRGNKIIISFWKNEISQSMCEKIAEKGAPVILTNFYGAITIVLMPKGKPG